MVPPRDNKIVNNSQLPQDRKKTQIGDILDQTERAHNERYIQQRAIKKNQEEARANYQRTHLPQRCASIHINDATKSKQEMDGMQESPLSDLNSKYDSNRIIKSV
jgi:hypothetical protein